MRTLAAFWVSEPWYGAFTHFIRSRSRSSRRYAIHARTRAVVLHDRVLNGRC